MNRRSILTATAALGIAAAVSACAPAAQNDIVSIASANDDFSTLVTAVSAAGLVETLQGDGPFTVFAPTNEAFAKLPAGTVETLLRPENRDQLVEILTYHVVPGNAPASALAGQTGTIPTVNGAALPVDGTNGVSVGGANVTSADITASNGIIHVIDTVMIPN